MGRVPDDGHTWWPCTRRGVTCRVEPYAWPWRALGRCAGGQQAEGPGPRSTAFSLCMKQNVFGKPAALVGGGHGLPPRSQVQKASVLQAPVPGRPKEQAPDEAHRRRPGLTAWWACLPGEAGVVLGRRVGTCPVALAISEGREQPAQLDPCSWKQMPPAHCPPIQEVRWGHGEPWGWGGRVLLGLMQTWAWPHWLAFLPPLGPEPVSSPRSRLPGRRLWLRLGSAASAPGGHDRAAPL